MPHLDRRAFLGSLLATTALPAPSWADAGNPAFLAAARIADETYALFGLDHQGAVAFSLPLPARAHAGAAHPSQPLAVVFARRPGTFAVVLDCASGTETARLQSPVGRHFYGHGVFSRDGTMLFTTENNPETGNGIIGIWDAGAGFRRIGEFSSNGIGPHEILRLPASDMLVIANGGIRTHPDTGRTKLNLNDMRPNLTYMSATGDVVETVELGAELHQNSIRHIAVSRSGLVAMAMQWQGALTQAPPLLALHRRGNKPQVLVAPPDRHRFMKGYGASVAFSQGDNMVGITGSRGGTAHFFHTASGEFAFDVQAPDVSGIAPGGQGFLLTNGRGSVFEVPRSGLERIRDYPGIAWDNHVVAVHRRGDV